MIEPFMNQDFRQGVGIMLTRKDKKIWVGERIDHPGHFQMPQGGIDDNETPESALFRELWEETGIPEKDVRVLASSNGWHIMHWPIEIQKKAWGGQFAGQMHKWFLLQLDLDHDPTILTHDIPEFSCHQWVDHSQIVNLTVEFKKHAYLNVLKEFEWYFND